MVEWFAMESLPLNTRVRLRHKKFGEEAGVYSLQKTPPRPLVFDAGSEPFPMDMVVGDPSQRGWLIGYDGGRFLGAYIADWKEVEWSQVETDLKGREQIVSL